MGLETLKAADVPAFLRDNLSSVISERVTEAIEKARKDAEATNPVQAAMAQAAAETERQKARRLDVAKTAAGRFMRAVAANHNNLQKAADYAKRQYGDDMVSKALAESTFVDGGAIVPVDFSDEVIGVLRAQSVVRSLGAREVPMPHGSLTMPYASTGVTAYPVAENANVTPSAMVFGQINMKAHKIMALVATSNELLQDASPAADRFIQDDLVQALRLQEDQYFIRGTGTNNTIRGLKYLAATTIHATNVAAAAGGSTTAEIIKDMMLVLQYIENGNIAIEKGGWILSPRTKYALWSLRDSVGGFLFKDQIDAGTLWGFPYRVTTTMPINLNTASLSSKESEICFADFDKILIGETGELSVQSYVGGAWYDATTSAVVSGISADQTVIVGKKRSDLAARYRGNEIVWLDQVTWGA